MVSQSYMLKKGGGPSRLTTGFNQAVMPVLIGAATDLEVATEILRVSVLRYKVLALALAVGAGMLAGGRKRRRRRGVAASRAIT
jgi:hypothetical protein